MLRTIGPYIPPILTTAILGSLFIHEYDAHAPQKFKLNLKPFLGKRSGPPPEFTGDSTPQRGVFTGNDRSYSAVLVVQATPQAERKTFAKCAAKACLKWDSKDVDISLGFAPRIWESVKGLVPLGNVGHPSSGDFKLKDRVADKSQRTISNTGGDIMVHIKADSRSACAEVVKSVLKELEATPISWSEDQYGYRPDSSSSPSSSLVCSSKNLSFNSSELCKIACVPKVGTSFALYQRWEDDTDNTKGKAKMVSNHAERVKGMDQDGNKLSIVRYTARTGKFGTRSGDDKAGMLFVGYSCDPRVFDYMLDRMVGKRGGVEDTTLSLSKCSRAQLFIIPSQAQICALAH